MKPTASSLFFLGGFPIIYIYTATYRFSCVIATELAVWAFYLETPACLTPIVRFLQAKREREMHVRHQYIFLTKCAYVEYKQNKNTRCYRNYEWVCFIYTYILRAYHSIKSKRICCCVASIYIYYILMSYAVIDHHSPMDKKGRNDNKKLISHSSRFIATTEFT